ncbi:hypothetical protein ACFWH4_24785, partial [Streptomyces sp. NPDC127091]
MRDVRVAALALLAAVPALGDLVGALDLAERGVLDLGVGGGGGWGAGGGWVGGGQGELLGRGHKRRVQVGDPTMHAVTAAIRAPRAVANKHLRSHAT